MNKILIYKGVKGMFFTIESINISAPENGVGREMQSHPNAKAPDHCKRKPRRADTKTAVELFTSHLKDSTPGGSIHGINAPRKKIVTGVVFHINLQ